ncbi:hypothetical protein C8R43DRAFT_959608 [Mycena crocata]|nr:hypothetical protein C8R43DRAFT_959608 [Mycena crocata]
MYLSAFQMSVESASSMSPTLSTVESPSRVPRVELNQLAEGIHVSYGNGQSNTDPRVIILFGWMDAPLRLLTRYAINHRLRWPTSDIVIVQSHAAYIWSSDEKRDDMLKPLAQFLVSTLYKQPEGGIFLHVLSNGGAFQLITLSRLLRSAIAPEHPSIRLATVIDSAPGTGEFSSLLTTVNTNMKSAAARAMSTIPVSILYLAIQVKKIASGQQNLFTDLHARLGMPELLPLTDPHAPRLYIYSASDAMVPATSVEKHIYNLQTSTPLSDVEVEKFSGSGHVMHERQDPVRYWRAVQAVWERSLPIRAKL